MSTTLDFSELNQMIGQLFMAGLPGTELDAGTEYLIRDYSPGGLILFSRNVQDPVQVATLCRNIQEVAVKYHGRPMFLAVDQEGGRVARLRKPFTEFPGNEAIGSAADPVNKAREFGQITAHELKLVGINMDFAPVMDVRRGVPDKVLKGRTFSDDPEAVCLLGDTVIRTLQENGIIAVAKHFPGLGSTNIDPHFQLPIINTDLEALEMINLPPFFAAIKANVAGIMTSHAIYPAFDADHSATLSVFVLNELLRKKMGYDGLIISDDLEMGAIANGRGVAQGAADSLKAGADIFLVCENQKYIKECVELILGMVLRGEISNKRLHQSHERIEIVRSRFLGREVRISLEKVKKYFRL